jgi:hypothetical protein
MSFDKILKAASGWPEDAVIKAEACDFFIHNKRVHSSDLVNHFFASQTQFETWLSQHKLRATKDGPIEIVVYVTSWYGHEYTGKTEFKFRNPDYVPASNRK